MYPYTFTFATYAKGRWVGRTIKDVLEKEFGFDQPEDLVSELLIVSNGLNVGNYTFKGAGILLNAFS